MLLHRTALFTALIALTVVVGCDPEAALHQVDEGTTCESDDMCPQDMICVRDHCTFGSRSDPGSTALTRADGGKDDGLVGDVDPSGVDDIDDFGGPDEPGQDEPNQDEPPPEPDSPDASTPAEECNGEDDDGDDRVDEEFACVRWSTGACTTSCGSAGTRTCGATCSWGGCEPPAETCNGADDNCDGAVDEGFDCHRGEEELCTASCGTTGRRSCTSACGWGSCAPPDEQCNGSDDDCDGSPDNRGGCRVPVYRFLCGTDHMYKNDSSTPSGCAIEGGGNPAWYNYNSLVVGSHLATTPLYRLFRASTPDHFMTASGIEADEAVAGGYVREGNIGYCSPNAVSGITVPLYRLWHPSNGDHIYTTNTTERDRAINVHGYGFLTTVCHVWRGSGG